MSPWLGFDVEAATVSQVPTGLCRLQPNDAKADAESIYLQLVQECDLESIDLFGWVG